MILFISIFYRVDANAYAYASKGMITSDKHKQHSLANVLNLESMRTQQLPRYPLTAQRTKGQIGYTSVPDHD